jgi:hypothetical protein
LSVYTGPLDRYFDYKFGDVPLFVEHCEAVAAKVDVKRRWHGEQGCHVSF